MSHFHQKISDTTETTEIFSVETIDSIRELGEVLKPIYLRMKQEGYGIVDGKLVKLES